MNIGKKSLGAIIYVLSAAILAVSGYFALKMKRVEDNLSMQSIVIYHENVYPRMNAQDLYKLLYQCAMGNGHFISDSSSARNYLEKEFAEIPPNKNHPILEPVSPDGKIVRLNIASYKARGGAVEPLFEAMMSTNESFKPDTSILIKSMKKTRELAKQDIFILKYTEVDSFFREMERMKYPAIHHSDDYRQAYHPSYRILLRSAIEKMKL